MNAIANLNQAGYAVDVITRHPLENYPPLSSLPANVKVWQCHPPSLRVKAWLNQKGLRTFSNVTAPAVGYTPTPTKPTAYERVKNTLVGPIAVQLLLLLDFIQFFLFAWRHLGRHAYCAFFGVDVYGVTTAGFFATLKRVPLIYWSLELIFMDDLRTWFERRFKAAEIAQSRRARLILIQDQLRAQSLIQENGVRLDQICIVPNAPMGFPSNEPSDFFQTKFNLSADQRVILQTGMIDPEALALEIATAATQWQPIYTLVLHDRMKRSRTEPYIAEILKATNNRTHLSLDPVPFDQIDRVVKSGHVGLVFYRSDLGANYAQMVGASGKMAYYLRCGLPIVCIDLPGMQERVEAYNCGICVHAIAEIEGVLDQIFADYATFSANARRCYQEQYEFNHFFEPVLTQVKQWCEAT